MMRFAAKLKTLLIGIWLGAVIGAGILTAPAIFTKIESRTMAGELFRVILQRLNVFEIICLLGIVILRIGFVFWIKKSGSSKMLDKDRSLLENKSVVKKLLPSDGILLLVLVNWFYYAQIITPEMTEIKKVIPSFDVKVTELAGDPTKSQELEARMRFDTLHKRYSKCMSGNIVLGVIMFFIP